MSSVTMMSSVLGFTSRLAVRALIAGSSHARPSPIIDECIEIAAITGADEPHCHAVIAHTNAHRVHTSIDGTICVPPRRTYSTQAAHVTVTEQHSSTTSTSGNEQEAIGKKRASLVARCGCAKDLAFAPSTALDSDTFGDDACFVERSGHADAFGLLLLLILLF